MFILLPVSAAGREFPATTAALIAANVLVFCAAWPQELARRSLVTEGQFEERAAKLVAVLLSPESQLKEAERALAGAEIVKRPLPSPELRALFARVQDDRFALSPEGRYRWDIAYPLFEASERSVKERPGKSTWFERFGFRIGGSMLPGLLTHQFLHAGLAHLFFNMLFLWVCGCALEPELGPRLLAVYLAGGAAAAMAQAAWGPPTSQVMVGASGAISAVMGFALLARPCASVKLFYLLILAISPRYGILDAPLWFFLPLWAFQQVWAGMLHARDAAVQVGYFAHAGGFAAGCLAGLSWRFFPAREGGRDAAA